MLFYIISSETRLVLHFLDFYSFLVVKSFKMMSKFTNKIKNYDVATLHKAINVTQWHNINGSI